MKNATAKNDVQVIQKALEEFLENWKAAKVAVEISATMREETQHTHMSEVFYINKDEFGALGLTKESKAKIKVEAILNFYLGKDEVQECLKFLIEEQLLSETKATTETAEFETIKVEGSDSKIYATLMKHKTANDAEAEFKNTLKEAISSSVPNFEVFVCDPSIDKNGKLQFVPGFEPAIGYSYNELEDLAEKNGLRLGNKFEYVLFLGTLINNLIAEGWSEADAWYSVCVDSKKLGHYWNSADAKHDFELTGSRKIVGKCDLANTYKVLAKDEKNVAFWLASGNYNVHSCNSPLASISLDYSCAKYYRHSVGWFVH